MDEFPWADFGLDPDADVRFGQLSGGSTPEALLWAVYGEDVLKRHLVARRLVGGIDRTMQAYVRSILEAVPPMMVKLGEAFASFGRGLIDAVTKISEAMVRAGLVEKRVKRRRHGKPPKVRYALVKQAQPQPWKVPR